MSIFQFTIGLSFFTKRHDLTVAFAYLFGVVYSIGEGPVPLVSTSNATTLVEMEAIC